MNEKTINAIVIQEIINYIESHTCKYSIECKEALNTAYNLYFMYKSNYDLHLFDSESLIEKLDKLSDQV